MTVWEGSIVIWFATASKDPEVTDLFTEGRHQRNISLVALNQNPYYSKDPTQKRNWHYLVMFNNPIDKQQVMTLARQMYPKNPQYFMHQFQVPGGGSESQYSRISKTLCQCTE